jgi:hypothetical protein
MKGECEDIQTATENEEQADRGQESDTSGGGTEVKAPTSWVGEYITIFQL